MNISGKFRKEKKEKRLTHNRRQHVADDRALSADVDQSDAQHRNSLAILQQQQLVVRIIGVPKIFVSVHEKIDELFSMHKQDEQL